MHLAIHVAAILHRELMAAIGVQYALQCSRIPARRSCAPEKRRLPAISNKMLRKIRNINAQYMRSECGCKLCGYIVAPAHAPTSDQVRAVGRARRPCLTMEIRENVPTQDSNPRTHMRAYGERLIIIQYKHTLLRDLEALMKCSNDTCQGGGGGQHVVTLIRASTTQALQTPILTLVAPSAFRAAATAAIIAYMLKMVSEPMTYNLPM